MYKKNKLKAKQLKNKYKDILKEMTFIGVTGTNGKTTVTTLVYKYFKFNNKKITLIGTNGIYINDDHYESINTTPGIEKLYNIIIESYNLGIRTIVMEVSSHAIKQYRVYGIKFEVKAITNITIDHLDYHKTFKDYKKTKFKFLKHSKVLINDEIDYVKINPFKKIYKYGMNDSYFNMRNLLISEDGIKFKLNINNNSYVIKSNLLGEFNCYNILLFIGIIYLLGEFDYYKLTNFLNEKITIDGRMERFNINDKTIIVDYAHTPDGMDKILSFVYETYKNNIITIFGCGGNRDQSKRELMGEVASLYSDYLIITNDNPRNEDEMDIINDILKGVTTKYKVIPNRKDAIDYGLSLLNNFNVLVILGRGNEDHIKIKDNLIPFNDVNYIKEMINDYRK